MNVRCLPGGDGVMVDSPWRVVTFRLQIVSGGFGPYRMGVNSLVLQRKTGQRQPLACWDFAPFPEACVCNAFAKTELL